MTNAIAIVVAIAGTVVVFGVASYVIGNLTGWCIFTSEPWNWRVLFRTRWPS